MSYLSKLLKWIFNFLYCLTVTLTVELIKAGLTILILAISIGLIFVTIIGAVWIAYTYSEGNVLTITSAFFLSILFVVLICAAVQYTLCDVLHLTDKRLPHLVKFYIGLIWTKRNSESSRQVCRHV